MTYIYLLFVHTCTTCMCVYMKLHMCTHEASHDLTTCVCNVPHTCSTCTCIYVLHIHMYTYILLLYALQSVVCIFSIN
jgi:hypothetical protein